MDNTGQDAKESTQRDEAVTTADPSITLYKMYINVLTLGFNLELSINTTKICFYTLGAGSRAYIYIHKNVNILRPHKHNTSVFTHSGTSNQA